MHEQPILLARQPIYDGSLNVVAFELLHRSIAADASHVLDGDEASSRVLLNAFGNVGLMEVTEGKPAFINFTSHLILNPPPLDPRHIVVEVLENVQVTAPLIEALKLLRGRGYRIALDDFEHNPSLEPLVELADVVKIDVLELDEKRVREEVRRLRNYPVRLLAEKIETWDVFNHCVDLGFSYFQGYFLARPQLVRGQRMDVTRSSTMNMLAQLSREDVDAIALSRTIATDPTLGIQLVKLVNSALYRPARPIESIRDTIVFLGVERIRGWCQLLALSRVSGKPRQLTRITMARARFCELLSAHHDPGTAPRYFLLGLLSTVDAFLDIEMATALNNLQISSELRAAIMQLEGRMGVVLKTALAFESAQWDQAPWDALAGIGVDQQLAEQDYLQSLQWVNETLQAIDI